MMKRLFCEHLIGFCAAGGAFCEARAHLVFASLALIVATVGTIDFARAADELPSQDQALGALENHPDIAAANAKVALAEAELYGKRMELSRQVLGLYGSLKTLDANIAQAKAALTQSNAESEQARAEAELVEAIGQREQAEYELRSLIGARSGAKDKKSSNAASAPARQEPLGPSVDTWKTKAEQPIKISFTDTPLVEVLNFLSDTTGIKFSVQVWAFEEAGVPMEMPISLSTNEVPLRAALQGLEDTVLGLQFVLRDYGVLLTTEESAQEHGYMPVVERANENGLRR
jgi:hypothetical protein